MKRRVKVKRKEGRRKGCDETILFGFYTELLERDSETTKSFTQIFPR